MRGLNSERTYHSARLAIQAQSQTFIQFAHQQQTTVYSGLG